MIRQEKYGYISAFSRNPILPFERDWYAAHSATKKGQGPTARLVLSVMLLVPSLSVGTVSMTLKEQAGPSETKSNNMMTVGFVLASSVAMVPFGPWPLFS